MEKSDRSLISLHVSPWSERARWALDHHQLAYRKIEHVPFLGERRLRKVVGPGKKRATVPVLLANGKVLTESWDIARYADGEGKGTPLIPADREAEIRRWNDLADKVMEAGRAVTIASMLSTEGALDEGLPPKVPPLIRRALRPLTRYGMKWFARKYELSLEDQEIKAAELRKTFTSLRNALAGSPYLLGTFSYADIVMATTFQGISPVDDRYLRLGPATRRAWTRADLATEFADLLRWRDEVYAEHRRPKTK